MDTKSHKGEESEKPIASGVERLEPLTCRLCGVPILEGRMCERCGELAMAGAPPARTSAPQTPSAVLLDGKYQLLDEIGRGAMGTVFRALDLGLDRVVAVKFLLPEFKSDPLFVDRFQREARTLASVNHRNVVQVFYSGRYDGLPFFVMEHIDGQTADEWMSAAIARRRLPPIHHSARILHQSAEGLADVHDAGVVHRDVKPDNIMLEESTGRAVVMDFGIGRQYKSNQDKRTMAPGGTPAYMAPEVAGGIVIPATNEFKADVYSFGATAFELFTGDLPFTSENWVDLLHKHIYDPPPRPSSIRSDIPGELDELIHRCLSKNPDERPDSCSEIAQVLKPFVTPPERGDAKKDKVRPSVQVRARRTATIGRSARVIVADDDDELRETLYRAAENLLPNASFRIARSNLDAIHLARRALPLVLFAPLEDDSLNGLELAAILSESALLTGMTVVLTATHISPGDRAMLELMGIGKILVKPASELELRNVLAEALAAPG